jgi:hypothetical protein
MNINMNKKEFVSHMTRFSLFDRGLIIQELIATSSGRMFELSIPGAFRKEISRLVSKFLHKGRLSPRDVWKLWVFAMKPIDDLKNWRITGDQCYKIKPKGTPWAFQRSQPVRHNKPKRRETIRDVNGDAVPRRWIDRFCPHVKTQQDWDQRSIYRQNNV